MLWEILENVAQPCTFWKRNQRPKEKVQPCWSKAGLGFQTTGRSSSFSWTASRAPRPSPWPVQLSLPLGSQVVPASAQAAPLASLILGEGGG